MKDEVRSRIARNKEERRKRLHKRRGQKPEEMKALSPDQIRAARLSMTTPMTHEQIAELIGVTRTTVTIWLNKPNVKNYMEDIRQAVERDTEGYIIGMFEDFRDTLHEIATDPDSNNRDKLKAIELAWKAAGLFKNKTEITVNETRKGLDNLLKSEDAEKFLEGIAAEWDEEDES